MRSAAIAHTAVRALLARSAAAAAASGGLSTGASRLLVRASAARPARDSIGGQRGLSVLGSESLDHGAGC